MLVCVGCLWCCEAAAVSFSFPLALAVAARGEGCFVCRLPRWGTRGEDRTLCIRRERASSMLALLLSLILLLVLLVLLVLLLFLVPSCSRGKEKKSEEKWAKGSFKYSTQ